jgi:hypothetical protein
LALLYPSFGTASSSPPLKCASLKNTILAKFNLLYETICSTLGFFEGFAHMGKQPDYRQLYEIAENQAGYFSSPQAAAGRFSWERLSGNVN